MQQLLVTAAVVLLMLLHLRSALTVAAMLPLAVLMTFIGMRLFGVEANIVALAGDRDCHWDHRRYGDYRYR